MAGKRAPHLGPVKRREPVLDAALEVFADGGFEAASMAAIAERAGVSKAVLYDVFPDGKAEMFDALLQRGEQQFVAHLAGLGEHPVGLSRDEVFRQQLSHFLEFAEVNPLVFQIVFGDVGTSTAEIARRHEAVRGRVIEEMSGRAMAGLAIPDAQAKAVDLYVHVIVAVAEELARWMLRNPDVPRDVVVALAVPFLLRGLDGILPPRT